MLARRASRVKQERVKRCDEGRARGPPNTSCKLPERIRRAYIRVAVRNHWSLIVTVAPSNDLTLAALDAASVRAAIGRCRNVIERHADYLTHLDAVLGDGDHGDNLVVGFRVVDAVLAELPDDTPPGELLRAVGLQMVATVGGASGPLYGTAFLEAAAIAGHRPELDQATLASMLNAAADGLARRGRCRVGDKTILDALRPAADTFQATGNAGAMVHAAARGMRSTRPLVARRGLALRLGSQSIGHLDPGAASCVLILRALVGR